MSSYYHPQHLAEFGKIAEGQPELGKKFFDYYGAVFAEGALTAREKSLIALAVAHAVQCPYCIDAYTKDALGKVRSATVAAARTLAARLDDPDDAKNARLWKEYREFLEQLIKIGEERSSEFDDVLRGLEASLRDTPAR